MVEVALEETIACTAEEYLDFVMDVERYRQVDDKLGRILWTRRRGDVLQFKFLPKLPGFRLPPVGTVSRMHLVPGARIDVELAPLPYNALSRGMSTFRASFACAPVDGGVRVRADDLVRFQPAGPLDLRARPAPDPAGLGRTRAPVEQDRARGRLIMMERLREFERS
jgi:hypothetical protein